MPQMAQFLGKMKKGASDESDLSDLSDTNLLTC